MGEEKYILLVFLTGAMATDLKNGKIYNGWILPAFLAGLLWRAASAGIRGAPGILLSILLPLALLLLFYGIGGIGAGDVKLLVTSSVFLPLRSFFTCLGASFLIAAFLSAILLFRRRERGLRIHFAVPVGIGFILHLGGYY
ncbi:MAG: prepilin peptidase [Eubacteriales bacterium]|nr:prepilin peptidase [Eubacteriales bacterium]